MNNNNNKTKISNNYKDYKYEYTGFKDYMKKHNLESNTIKNEKENIVHDHRLQFDFNNPNQHYHDYSFNHQKEDHPKFRTNPEVDSKKPATKPTTYSTRPNPYQQPQHTPNANPQNRNNSNSGCLQVVFVFFFIFIFFSIIIAFTNDTNIDNDYDYDYNDDYYYTDDDEDYIEENTYKEDDLVSYTEPYDEALNSYLNAITHLDYNYVKNSLTEEELNYNDGQNWQNTILLISNEITEYDGYSFSYSYQYKQAITNTVLESLNQRFQADFDSSREITEAYRLILNIYINDHSFVKNITVGKIDNTWYLIRPY